MFPWEVHNGWSPSLVQLISVISAIGWAPASLNPLSLLHLPPSPPPHFFFLFSRIVPPGERPFLRTGFATRRPPQPFARRFFHRFEVKMKKKKRKRDRGTHSLNFPNQVFPNRFVRFHFPRFLEDPLFSFPFFFYGKSNLYDQKERRWNPFYSLVKYRNTVVYLLWIYFLRVFCTSIISIPHNVLHKYSRSGDSER